MSSESIVSRPFHFFDVPEVVSLTSKFQYNFFMSDEKINESGDEAVDGNLSSRFLNKGTADITNLNARTPRYIELNWFVKDTKRSMLATKNSAIKTTRDEIMLALEQGKIYTETQAAGIDFDSYVFENSKLQSNLENFFRRRLTSFGEEEATPLELLTKLAEHSSVDSDLLESLLPPSLKDDDGADIKSNFFEDEKKEYGVGILNTAHAPTFFRNSADIGTAINSYAVVHDFMAATKNKQPDLSSYASNAEYLFDVPFTSLALAEDSSFVAQADVIGFIFEKTRIYDGVRYPMPPVIAAGTDIRAAYDSEVAYGMTYEYSARTIAKFRIPLTDYTTGEVFIGTFLLSSRPSAVATVTCTENRRPEPPNDINFYFNYDDENLTLTWAPPVNSQRDVKYLQIYRRESIDEPFELLVQYDWDDSIIRTSPLEFIDPDAIISKISMPTYYIDPEFGKTKSYIYALVTIDARQLSSRYSTQIQVSFDETTNRITKTFISYAGAPVQYPNWYLKENFFVDSMKDSTHKQAFVYFDPEAYKLTKQSGEEVYPFYSESRDPLAKYVLQMINTDRLGEVQIDITLDDSVLNNEKSVKKAQFSSEICKS